MRLARLTQRSEFLAAAEHGRRFRSYAFTAQVLDRADGEPGSDGLRLGLTASRKTGNAVKRNRIRRRLREAAKHALAAQSDRACDIVVVARTEVLGADFKVLVTELSVALDRARPAKPNRSSDKRRPTGGHGAPAKP
jgi:ribonuclease P protein component